jgi:hypothetical protein
VAYRVVVEDAAARTIRKLSRPTQRQALQSPAQHGAGWRLDRRQLAEDRGQGVVVVTVDEKVVAHGEQHVDASLFRQAPQQLREACWASGGFWVNSPSNWSTTSNASP